MPRKWKYMDNEYTCDICNPECYEKLGTALNMLCSSLSEIDYGKSGAEAANTHNLADKLRKNCEVIEGFFDSLFGEECRKTICGETMDIINCFSALASFICHINEQISDMESSGDEIKALLTQRLAVI